MVTPPVWLFLLTTLSPKLEYLSPYFASTTKAASTRNQRGLSSIRMTMTSDTDNTNMQPAPSDKDDRWAAQASLYANQAARITELHGADLVSLLKEDILRAKTILDVGCGTGAFARAYLQQFPRGIPGQTLVMTDLSQGMLDKARETVLPPGHDFATKIVFQQEDGTKLSGIADDSVDLVVSLFGVFLIPDQQATLASIQRVLKAGSGVFGNASWMFDVSDDFASRGFGVSLQDAFVVPNKVIKPDEDPDSPHHKWSNRKEVEAMFAGNCASIRCRSALHANVWEWEDLWQVMAQNPMSAIPTASASDVDKAKTALKDFVTQGGSIPIDEPLVLSTASLLTVVQGFGDQGGEK